MKREFHRMGWTWWLIAMWVGGEVATFVLLKTGSFPWNIPLGMVGYVGAPVIAIIRGRSIRKREQAAIMMITSDF